MLKTLTKSKNKINNLANYNSTRNPNLVDQSKQEKLYKRSDIIDGFAFLMVGIAVITVVGGTGYLFIKQMNK